MGIPLRVGLPPARVPVEYKKRGFWYFLICNTFRLLVRGVCHSKKGGFRFAAWRGVPCGPQSLCCPSQFGYWTAIEKGVRLTSYPFLLPLLQFSFRVRTYKSTSIALSAVLSHQNIKGSGAFATYRCTRGFCRRPLIVPSCFSASEKRGSMPTDFPPIDRPSLLCRSIHIAWFSRGA